MMEVKQNTAVDLNDLLAPVKNNDDGTDEVDDVVMTDLTEEARDLNADLIHSNEKCNNGLITNGDETLSSLIDLDATAAALDLDSTAAALEAPVSTELEDALLAEDDVLPKLADPKANVAPSSEDILADKVETSNSTTSSNNVRDPGDDLDTLLSKINDIVEDCLDNEITAAAVEEKDLVETKETVVTADAASDSKAESFDESVILLDDTAIEDSIITTESVKTNPDKNHQEPEETEVKDHDAETEKDLNNGNNTETMSEGENATGVAEVSVTEVKVTSETATTDVAVIEAASVVSENAVVEIDPTEAISDILDEKVDETVDEKIEDDLSDVTKDANSITLISEKQIEEDSKLLEEDISNEIEPKTGEEEPTTAEEEPTNSEKASTSDEEKTKTDEQEPKTGEEETKTEKKEPQIDGQQSTAVTDQHKDEDKVENEDSDDEIVFYVDKPPETEKPKKTSGETEPTPKISEKKTEEEAQQEEPAKSIDDDDVVILDDDEEMETDKKISESSSSPKEKDSTDDKVSKEPQNDQIKEKTLSTADEPTEKSAKEDKKHSTIDIDNSDNARDDFVVTEKPVAEANKPQETEETNSNCSSSSNLLLEAKQNENTGDEPIQEENDNENEEEDDDGDVELIESESKEAENSSEKGEESSEIVPPAKRPRLSEDSEVSSKTDETSRSQKTSESGEKKTELETQVKVTETATPTTPSLKRSHDVIELELDDDKSNDSKSSSAETLNKKPRTEELKPKEENAQITDVEEKEPLAKVEEDDKDDVKKDMVKMVPSDVPIPLYPPPKFKTLCSEESISLDFLKKFRKSFDKMTKHDLEELVLQKVVEAIIHRSEFAEMRELIEKQEKLITSHRTKISELSKQFRDLEMVHNRVVKDIDQRNSQFIMPVKITRAVGLQVYIPNKKAVLESTANSNTPSIPASSPQRSVTSTQSNLTSPQRQYHHSSQLADAQARVGGSTSSINSATSTTSAPRRGCAQKITPIRPVPSSNSLSASATPPSSANTQVYRSNQNQISSQPRILNKNASTGTAGAATSGSASAIQRLRYMQTSGQDTAQQQRVQTQQINRPSANAVNSQRVAPQQKLSTNSSSVQRRPEPTASSGSNSSASLDSYMNTLSQLTGGNTAVSITPAKPKEKAVIDLTDEDETPPAPPAISAPQTNNVPVNQGQRRSLPPQGSNANSTLQQYSRTAPPLARIPPTSQMANSNKSRQMALQGQKSNSFTSTISTPAGTSITRINVAANTQGSQRVKYSHPAPLPATPPQAFNPSWKLPPPRPTIRISNLDNGIVISWTMEESMDRHAECVSYQIYAYQETSGPPTGDSWRHVGDVKAMLLPMAVTLTQFQEGQRYYFAVRAVDCHQRYGPFSLPKTWS